MRVPCYNFEFLLAQVIKLLNNSKCWKVAEGKILSMFQSFYSDKFGQENVVMIKDSNTVEREKLNPEKVCILIHVYEYCQRSTYFFGTVMHMQKYQYTVSFVPGCNRDHWNWHVKHWNWPLYYQTIEMSWIHQWQSNLIVFVSRAMCRSPMWSHTLTYMNLRTGSHSLTKTTT